MSYSDLLAPRVVPLGIYGYMGIWVYMGIYAYGMVSNSMVLLESILVGMISNSMIL